MSTLHVRDVPDDLYDKIKQAAAQENRSISAQVIELLQLALAQTEAANQQGKVLREIHRRRLKYETGASTSDKQYPDAVQLIREGRDR
jgi:plasmid stability protein